MEPTKGFEPLTCCLRNSCSATELRRHHAEWQSTTSLVPVQARDQPPHTARAVQGVRAYSLMPDVHASRAARRYGENG